MTTRVTFKDEGQQGTETIGPVKVIDVETFNADPKVSAGGMWPFNYQPQGLTDLGWMTRSDAQQVAAQHNVQLEEV